ncbi:STAS-like domain-containing protein [Lactiplantibacillus plantarum]|uniref:STAS-like domain-containing protein n=1 Tax=Lactiplantibacillus plantarum TaxID=1590 RepID=UPI0032DF4586
MKTINIKDEINSNLAVTSSQANKIFKILNANLKKQESTRIDFSGIETITTAFLNTAIGQLYSIGDSSILNKYVIIEGQTLTSVQRDKVRLVMENAKNKLTKEEVHKELNHGEI